MKYEFKEFYGRPLYTGSAPVRQVVNNGCIIETDSEDLIRQLEENERDRTGSVVDWYLFKPGKTILTDNYGNQYGCTMNNDGRWIRLERIIG